MKNIKILLASAFLVAGCSSNSAMEWQQHERENNPAPINSAGRDFVVESIDNDETPDVIKSAKTGEIYWVQPAYADKFKDARIMTPQMASLTEKYFTARNERERVMITKTGKNGTYVVWAPHEITIPAIRNYANSRDSLNIEIESSLRRTK